MSEGTMTADVAIVGASLAGCTAATLLAREGVRVALIEKHGDPSAYKRLCGHFIQSSATPVLRRLGVVEEIEAAGGIRNGADIWTRWGWIAPRPEPGEQPAYGYNIRRAKLDPMVRRLATGTPGVTYLGGTAVTGLVEVDGAVAGLIARDRAGNDVRIDARLVVGADGRNSAVAKLAGAPERRRTNNRFCYMAYFRGIRHRPDGRTWFWSLDPDVVIGAPNDEGLTLIALFVHKDRLPDFRADLEGAFRSLATSVAEDPGFGAAERVSKFVGYRDYPIVARPPVPRRGVALVGDAALSTDPTMAIGCGWALQSGSWLADAVTPALRGDGSLDRGLRRYRVEYRRRLSGHARMLAEAAKARPASPVERLMFSAAARDQRTARLFEAFASRSIPVRRFLAPRAIARAAWVNAR